MDAVTFKFEEWDSDSKSQSRVPKFVGEIYRSREQKSRRSLLNHKQLHLNQHRDAADRHVGSEKDLYLQGLQTGSQ